MREIRSRISQRHGIELTTQQIQELAARRLEAILDPRTVKPSLLEQIRKSTTTPIDGPSAPEPAYSFEDTTIYDSPRGSLRFLRRLLNPLLKLFFNPNPLISALHAQTKLNQAAAQREAERDRRQAEWNALHYEILQRLVLEISRTSLEAQQLSLRVDALSAKVDFAERRARSIESSLHQTRPAPRHGENAPPPPPPPIQPPREPSTPETTSSAPPPQPEAGTGEGGRRRRRRRRGRRPQGLTPDGAMIGVAAGGVAPDSRVAPDADAQDGDEPDDEDAGPDFAGDEGDAIEAAPATAVADAYAAPAAVAEAYAAPADAPDAAVVEMPVETSAETPVEAAAAPPEPAAAEQPEQPRPSDPVGD